MSQSVRDFIDEQLKGNPALAASGLPARVLYQIAQMSLKERFKTFFTEAVPMMTAMFEFLDAQAPSSAREGHNKALSTSIAPDRRIDMLKALRWKVLPTQGEGFVLPDCVALAEDDGSGLKPLIAADLDKVKVVLMPLSSDRMLVGIRPSAAAPALSGFNEAAAAASHAFFIAAELNDKLTLLPERIGQSSDQFVHQTIGSVFDEFLTTRGAAPLPSADRSFGQLDSPDKNNPVLSPPTAPKYTVHFHSCADQGTAEKIAAALHAVTENIVPIMSLDRLDGITFSGNYAASLRDLGLSIRRRSGQTAFCRDAPD